MHCQLLKACSKICTIVLNCTYNEENIFILFQSPLEELQQLTVTDETNATPEPGGEAEIEIAAAEDDGGSVGSGESDQLRSAAIRLKLGGILQSTTRPGSSLSSRINSGCSTPNSTPVYRPEALQYPCTNFVHSSPATSDLGLDCKDQVGLRFEKCSCDKLYLG